MTEPSKPATPIRRVYKVTIGEGPHPEEIFWSTDHDDPDRVMADVRYFFNYLPDAPMKVERYYEGLMP